MKVRIDDRGRPAKRRRRKAVSDEEDDGIAESDLVTLTKEAEDGETGPLDDDLCRR